MANWWGWRTGWVEPPRYLRKIDVAPPPRRVSFWARCAVMFTLNVQLPATISFGSSCLYALIASGANASHLVGLLFWVTVATGWLLSRLAPGVTHARLLAVGTLGYARLVGKRSLKTKSDIEHFYEMTFQLDLPPEATPPGYRSSWSQWARHNFFTFVAQEVVRLQDEPVEPVLYLPERPGVGVPLDGIPVTVASDGGFDAVRSPALRMVMPISALLLFAANLARASVALLS